MVQPFTITATTPNEQVRDFVSAMQSIGSRHAVRSIQFALNGVAIDARQRVIDGLDRVFDKPGAFTLKGVIAKSKKLPGRGSVQSIYDLSSRIEVRALQSIYFKYAMGEDERLPGDIGPADKKIYVPNWQVIKSMTAKRAGVNIKQTNEGNMPRKSLQKLMKMSTRAANAPRRRYRTKRRSLIQGLWYGTYGAGKPTGWWLRPERIRKGEKWKQASGRSKRKVINSGAPRLLVGAFDRADYTDILIPLWNQSAADAMAELPRRLEREFAVELAWIASGRQGRRGGRS
jgi:hypothetical protein